jgi:hypothetical protein
MAAMNGTMEIVTRSGKVVSVQAIFPGRTWSLSVDSMQVAVITGKRRLAAIRSVVEASDAVTWQSIGSECFAWQRANPRP